MFEWSKNVGDPDASFEQRSGERRVSSLARSSIDARGIDANELVAKRMATMKKKVLLIKTRLAAKGRKVGYSSSRVTQIGVARSSLATECVAAWISLSWRIETFV